MEKEILKVEYLLERLREIKIPSLTSSSYPINEIEEKAKFFSIYHDPKFIYSHIPEERLIQNLNTLRIIKNKLREEDVNIDIKLLAEGIIKRKENEIMYLLNLGKKTNIEYSVKIDGSPSYETYKIAINMAENIEPEKDEEVMDVFTARKFFTHMLNKYGLNWKVIIDKGIAVSVCGDRNALILPLNRKFTPKDILRLGVHEIGTHIFRKENTRRQRYLLFKFPFPNYLIAEEGLALYHEYKHDLMSKQKLKEYALRYIAVYSMYELNSFKETFRQLMDFNIPREDAWRITLRAYRGGGMIKDYVYLEGFLSVKNIIERKGKRMETLLMCCMTDLNHIDLIKQMINQGIINYPYYTEFIPLISEKEIIAPSF